jgi:DNA-binding NtrC family response regulator
MPDLSEKPAPAPQTGIARLDSYSAAAPAPARHASHSQEESYTPEILSDEETLDVESTEETQERMSLQDLEIDMIRKAIERHRGRRKEAAEELGISERTLYRKIKQFNLG